MITSATIYSTSLCNSGCLTCDIWKTKQREEFDHNLFDTIIRLPFLSGAVWTLIGGEITIHKNYIDIVESLNRAGKNYYFISNGILPEKIKKIYERTTLSHLSLSLDALGEKHDYIRGAKHNFQKIDSLIDWVKLHHPETDVRIGYTLSNFNTREDLISVLAYAKAKKVGVKLSVAAQSELFSANSDTMDLTADELYQFEDLVERDQYLDLYRPWVKGWFTKCHGIKEHLVLQYNGDVLLCEAKIVKLFNIFDGLNEIEKLDNIMVAKNLEKKWFSSRVQLILKEYEDCNDCWMSCVRKADAKRFTNEEVAQINAGYRF